MNSYLGIGLILVIMIVAFLLLISFSKKNKDKSNKKDEKKDISGNSNNESATKDNIKREDVFKFMEFDRIQDNMIIQDGGKRYTMAIRCKGINYDLMSEAEQMAVEQGFITFLNTLKYPIQLYVQAQNVDLKDVVKGYKEKIEPLQDEYAKYNSLYEEKSGIFDIDKEELEEIDSERTKIANVYDYAQDIITYVERMSVNKNLLQRNFYVIVSYSKGDIAAVDKFTKEEAEEMCRTELVTRCSSIISALSSSSVMGTILDSNELADLLYVAYNRDDKSVFGVRDALESGFYRLYSTSRDAFEKQDEILRDSIQTEAKLKAITSLKKAIEEGTHKTETQKELDNTEEIAREATEMIKAESSLDPDIKQDVLNDIMDDYREEKRELTEKINIEKEELEKSTNEEYEELKEKYEQTNLYEINKKKENAINEYNEEIKKEKEELIQKINENGGNVKELYSGEDDSI